MTTLKKLDSMLQVFVDNRFKQQIDLAYLYKEFVKMGIEFGEVSDVLRKLLADGYLEKLESGVPDTDDYRVFYKVSFNGLVFNEQDGYMGEVLEKQRLVKLEGRERRLSLATFRLTVVLALSAFVGALYYCVDLYWRHGWFQSRFWWTLSVAVVLLCALTTYLIWRLLPQKKQRKE